MDILEEIHVIQHELGRHVILEGDDVRIVDGAMGMVFLNERSMLKDRGGQRGSEGDRDKKQGSGNTSHGGQKQPAHSEFISKLLIRIWLLPAACLVHIEQNKHKGNNLISIKANLITLRITSTPRYLLALRQG